MRRSLVAVTCFLLVFLVVPSAFADGDPAADYLLEQTVFLSPDDARIPARQATALTALVTFVRAHGLRLRVAVIDTRYDLGSDPFLYRKPQTYARFLATEDRYIWQDELLVVMPNGYGLYGRRGVSEGDRKAIAALPWFDTTSGPALGSAADRAVRALAVHRRLSLPTDGHGNAAWVTDTVVGGVLIAFAAAGGVLGLRHRRRAG